MTFKNSSNFNGTLGCLVGSVVDPFAIGGGNYNRLRRDGDATRVAIDRVVRGFVNAVGILNLYYDQILMRTAVSIARC